MKNTLLIKGESPVRFQPTIYQIIKYFHYVERNDDYIQDQVSTYLDAVFIQKIHEDCVNKGVVVNENKWITYSINSFHDEYEYITKKMLLSSINRLEDCGLLLRKVAPIEGLMAKILPIYKKKWYFRVDYDKLSDGLRVIQTLRAKGFAEFKPKGVGKPNKRRTDT